MIVFLFYLFVSSKNFIRFVREKNFYSGIFVEFLLLILLLLLGPGFQYKVHFFFLWLILGNAFQVHSSFRVTGASKLILLFIIFSFFAYFSHFVSFKAYLFSVLYKFLLKFLFLMYLPCHGHHSLKNHFHQPVLHIHLPWPCLDSIDFDYHCCLCVLFFVFYACITLITAIFKQFKILLDKSKFWSLFKYFLPVQKSTLMLNQLVC